MMTRKAKIRKSREELSKSLLKENRQKNNIIWFKQKCMTFSQIN